METTASQPTSPAVFGRKELKQAQEKKRKLREQALYGD
jgi:ubiquitin